MGKTPGLNLPYGIDPVNAVPVDANYGPYASVAAAKAAVPLALRYDGLTVQITGTGEYHWLDADLSDSGLVAKTGGGGGGGLPKVRYVYLVQDASDATLMGDAVGNAYTTFQAAYDAAVVIQTALGGSNKVVIQVGNIDAATSGNLTLSANWNAHIILEGISSEVSVLGNIIAQQAAAGWTVVITANYVTIGTITTSPTASGAGAIVTLTAKLSTIGNIITSSAFGAGGAVTLNISDCILADITTSSGGTGAGGSVTATFANNYTSSIASISTISAGTTGSAGAVSIQGKEIYVTSITTSCSVSGATGTGGNITLIGSVFVSGAIVSNNSGGTTGGSLTCNLNEGSEGSINTFSSTGANAGAGGVISITGYLIEGSISSIGGTTGLAGAITLTKCKQLAGTITQSFNGTGGGNLLITDCSVNAVTKIFNTNTTTAGGSINITRSIVTGALLLTRLTGTSGPIGGISLRGCILASTVRFMVPSGADGTATLKSTIVLDETVISVNSLEIADYGSTLGTLANITLNKSRINDLYLGIINANASVLSCTDCTISSISITIEDTNAVGGINTPTITATNCIFLTTAVFITDINLTGTTLNPITLLNCTASRFFQIEIAEILSTSGIEITNSSCKNGENTIAVALGEFTDTPIRLINSKWAGSLNLGTVGRNNVEITNSSGVIDEFGTPAEVIFADIFTKTILKTNRKGTPLTLTNSTTPTNLLSGSNIVKKLPVGMFKEVELNKGYQYLIKLSGIYSTAAVPGNLTLDVKIGSVILATAVIALTGALTNELVDIEVPVIIQDVTTNTAIETRTSGSVKFLIGTDVLNAKKLSNTSTVTFDNTVANLLEVVGTFSVADAANSLTITNASIEESATIINT